VIEGAEIVQHFPTWSCRRCRRQLCQAAFSGRRRSRLAWPARTRDGGTDDDRAVAGHRDRGARRIRRADRTLRRRVESILTPLAKIAIFCHPPSKFCTPLIACYFRFFLSLFFSTRPNEFFQILAYLNTGFDYWLCYFCYFRRGGLRGRNPTPTTHSSAPVCNSRAHRRPTVVTPQRLSGSVNT
jgi:hypothetical protein